MDTPPLAEASSSVLRLPQKTSGPFNTDLTDVTSPVASVPDFLSLDSLFTDEEHNLFGASSSLPQVDDLDSTMTKAEVTADSLVDIDDLKVTLDFDLENGSNFLENFTDLTNYLMDTEAQDTAETPVEILVSLEEPMTLDESAILDEMFKSLAPVTIDTNPVEVAPSVEEGRNPKGRKRKAVATSTMVKSMGAEDDTISVAECSSDHSYTAKRRCVSTVTMETSSAADSDDESVPLSKEVKYLERRRKNNIASKRSRETRKQKFTAMEQQAIDLEKANENLRAKVTQLEELAKEMKDALIKRLANSK